MEIEFGKDGEEHILDAVLVLATAGTGGARNYGVIVEGREGDAAGWVFGGQKL